MNENKPLCVIVPDVHGRGFWKDPKEYDCDVIFLGDYLDPYPFEGINNKDALENFKDIIEYMHGHENATFLLGNHDLEYMIGTYICDCRRDYWNYNEIRDLFRENSDKFKLAVKRNYGGVDYLFSHAGVHPNWLEKYSGGMDLEYILNWEYVNPDDPNTEPESTNDIYNFNNELADVSHFRGGYDDIGSIVWSDIQEWEGITTDDRLHQIVGHTYLKSSPIGNDSITCLDCRRIFLIDENGNICEKDMKPIEKVSF